MGMQVRLWEHSVCQQYGTKAQRYEVLWLPSEEIGLLIRGEVVSSKAVAVFKDSLRIRYLNGTLAQ